MVERIKKFKLIVLIAAPGSGKGTLSELLKERRGFFIFSAGKTFRTMVTKTKEEKLKVVNKGGYLPDEIVNKYSIQELEIIQNEALRKTSEEEVYIVLDGYPRTMGQATELEKWAKNKELLIVKLEGLSNIRIQERLSNRYLCEANEHIFNKLNKDFPKDRRCPKDGSALIKRSDDSKIEVMQKRFKLHESLTSPICKYFESKNITTYSIDSSLSIEEMYSSFCTKLGL